MRAAAGHYSKSDRTVDNAVGTVVTKAQAAPGSVKRLTVAVVLDAAKAGVNTADIQQLVGNAVGLDTKRGDSVQVSSVAFDTTAAKAAAKQLTDAQAAERTARLPRAGQEGGDRPGAARLRCRREAPARDRGAEPGSRRSPPTCPAEGTVLPAPRGRTDGRAGCRAGGRRGLPAGGASACGPS